MGHNRRAPSRVAAAASCRAAAHVAMNRRNRLSSGEGPSSCSTGPLGSSSDCCQSMANSGASGGGGAAGACICAAAVRTRPWLSGRE
eukprot:4661892-Prymnesium_polylepis.2